MKKLIFLGILAILIIASGYAIESDEVILNDYLKNYADAEIPENLENDIISLAKEIKESGKAEYAIVLVDSLEGKDIESYALEVAQGNLGDEDKNNGLLLLISIKDRKYRFEVGRGLEPIFNDAKIGRIGRNNLVDNFKKNNYGKGIYESSIAIYDELEIDGNYTGLYEENVNKNKRKDYINLGIYVSLVVIFLFGRIFQGFFYKRRRNNNYFAAAYMATSLLNKGGKGGFGGFGGGGFGGGGASGGW
ncbi:MAG: TPM domain-containing protein [Nanobdellota archaeon]